MKRFFSRLAAPVFALGFCLVVAASPPVNARDPQFTLIAESTASAPLNSDFAMNNAGTVVYSTSPVVTGFPQTRNVFTSNGRSSAQVAHYECEPICNAIQPSINNGGTVALLRAEGRFTFNFFSIDILRNGTIISIASVGERFKSMRAPAINEGGDVVYLGPKPATQSDLAIFCIETGRRLSCRRGQSLGCPRLTTPPPLSIPDKPSKALPRYLLAATCFARPFWTTAGHSILLALTR